MAVYKIMYAEEGRKCFLLYVFCSWLTSHITENVILHPSQLVAIV